MVGMKNLESLKNKLIQLADEVNSHPDCNIKFHQQNVIKENMSFSGGNGRVWVSPFQSQYDICLSGKSLEKQMCGFMMSLCDKRNDGYKQTKPEPHAPFWRVTDFEIVKKVVYQYAKTKN